MISSWRVWYAISGKRNAAKGWVSAGLGIWKCGGGVLELMWVPIMRSLSGGGLKTAKG
ncbi:MAG: hypothetical protein IJ658_00915 [Kiritimatiellae bacterium]|nr:hypothetical protein [Kiritimatiellia bacterium]